jgi:hypothetical protein
LKNKPSKRAARKWAANRVNKEKGGLEEWTSVPIGSPVGQNETAWPSHDHRNQSKRYLPHLQWELLSTDIIPSPKEIPKVFHFNRSYKFLGYVQLKENPKTFSKGDKN